MVGHSCCHTHSAPRATRASTIIIFLLEWHRHWDCSVGEMGGMCDFIQSQQVLVVAFALGEKQLYLNFLWLYSTAALLLEGHSLLWNAANMLFSEICTFFKRRISLINKRSQCHSHLCTGFC